MPAIPAAPATLTAGGLHMSGPPLDAEPLAAPVDQGRGVGGVEVTQGDVLTGIEVRNVDNGS